MGVAPQEGLCDALGYRFTRPEILAEALTHPSLPPGKGDKRLAYDRLEFLGDRVLGVIVAEDLLRRYRQAAVGSVAPRFNALVRQEALVRVATELSTSTYINLMDQYTPAYQSEKFPELGRGIYPEEFRAARKSARDQGLRRLDTRLPRRRAFAG